MDFVCNKRDCMDTYAMNLITIPGADIGLPGVNNDSCYPIQASHNMVGSFVVKVPWYAIFRYHSLGTAFIVENIIGIPGHCVGTMILFRLHVRTTYSQPMFLATDCCCHDYDIRWKVVYCCFQCQNGYVV